jgi:hypothetical protein
MILELKRRVSAPTNRSAVLPVALAKAVAAFCSIGVRDFPTGVSCSPRVVVPNRNGNLGKRDHRTDA